MYFLFTMSDNPPQRRWTLSPCSRQSETLSRTNQRMRAAHRLRCQSLWPNNLAEGILSGGARRDRTDDLMLAKHALSQLSYGPIQRGKARTPKPLLRCSALAFQWRMVGLGRLELPTSRLSSARSNQLSYKPQAQARRFQPNEPSTRSSRISFARPNPFVAQGSRVARDIRPNAGKPRGLVREERETKAAKSRMFGLNGHMFQVIR